MSSSAIFISYRRVDSADVAGRIHDRLRQHFGSEAVFIDTNGVPLGVDVRALIQERLRDCRVLLALVGKTWLDAADSKGRRRLDDPDDIVRLEIETALRKGIPVIPLLVHGSPMPTAEQLPPSLRDLANRNGAPVRPDPDFRNDIGRLIASLEAHVPVVAPVLETTRPELTGDVPDRAGLAPGILILLVAEACQLLLFLATESDGWRWVGVIVPTVVGAVMLALSAVRRRFAEAGLGLAAVAVPWLLQLVAPPLPAISGTVAVVTALALLVVRPFEVWRRRNKPASAPNLSGYGGPR